MSGRRVAGKRVAIVGAGGIGFDVAELLTHASNGAHDGRLPIDAAGTRDDPELDAFRDEWGIDADYAQRGGVKTPVDSAPPREVWLLQRKSSKVGASLAKTTGWIRRALLKKRGVTMLAGVDYVRIDDAGLHITVDGTPRVLDVDTIVVCAGQEPNRALVSDLAALGVDTTLIGGADVAVELDAKRAIEQGTRVAMSL